MGTEEPVSGVAAPLAAAAVAQRIAESGNGREANEATT